MGRGNQVIDIFLTAYNRNDLNTLRSILADDIQICFSTVGTHSGLEQVLQALAWKQDFSVHTVTTTNVMSYEDAGRSVTALIAHHLVANETGSEIYPLNFGGKYVFVIDNATGKIIRICYAQEYQVENTLYIRDWNLAGRISDLSVVSEFDLEKAYTAAMALADTEAIVAALSKMFFWAVDAKEMTFVEKLSCNSIHMLRPKTMSYGKFEVNGTENLEKFIDETKEYYSMDQHSFTVNRVSEQSGKIVVSASHLVPHRLGTKKLTVNTKYHSFFDEDIIITFVKAGDTYLIEDVTMKKIVDVHYNGFEILHL